MRNAHVLGCSVALLGTSGAKQGAEVRAVSRGTQARIFFPLCLAAKPLPNSQVREDGFFILRNHDPLPRWGALPKGRGDSHQPPFTPPCSQPAHPLDTRLWPWVHGQLTFSLSSERERLSTLRHERICSCSSSEKGWDRLFRNSSAERGRRRL